MTNKPLRPLHQTSQQDLTLPLHDRPIPLYRLRIQSRPQKPAIDPMPRMYMADMKHRPLPLHQLLVHLPVDPVAIYRGTGLQEIRHGGVGVEDDGTLIVDAEGEDGTCERCYRTEREVCKWYAP